MKRKIDKIFLILAVLITVMTFSSCSQGNYPKGVRYEKSYKYKRAKCKTVKPVPPKVTSAYSNFQIDKSNKQYLGQKKKARKSSGYYDRGTVRNKTLGQESH